MRNLQLGGVEMLMAYPREPQPFLEETGRLGKRKSTGLEGMDGLL